MTPRRAISRLLLALTGALAALVLGVTGLGLALSHGWQRERLRSFAETELARALADTGVRGELRVGALTGPLYPSFGLREVALVRDGVTLARVASADVSLDLGSLWARRRLILSRVRIEGAQLSLAPDAGGAWPWQLEPAQAPAPGAAQPERPLELEIRELQVSDSGFDAAWIQAGRPSHVAGTLDALLRGWVLPRAGEPPFPEAASAQLAIAPGMVAGRALLGAQLAMELDGSKLRLGDSRLDSAFGRMRLTGETDLAGWLDPAAPASARIEGSADALDLAVLLGRPDLAGSVGGTLRVDASHSPDTELRDSRAEVSLALGRSRLGRLAVASGELRGVYESGRWRLESASFRSNAARLEARGRGDLERIESLEADLEVTDLAALAAVVASDARGKARAKLAVSGPWRAPSGVLELEARELRAAGLELGNAKLRARSVGLDRYRIEPLAIDGPALRAAADGPVALRRAGDGVRIERARFALGEGEIVELRGAVSPSAVRDLRIDVDGIALQRFAALAGLDERLGGRVSGQLTAHGALPRPALSGHLAWQAPEVGELSAQAIAFDVATQAGLLRADGRITARGTDLLRAKLALPWSARIPLGRLLERPETLLQITGADVDLGLLRELAPQTLGRVEGSANLRIELRGDRPQPHLDGELTVANASCELPTLAQRLGPLDARLVLTAESVRVDSFRLRAGSSGLAELSGEVRLANLRPAAADLELSLRDFPIRWQTVLQASTFGRLQLRGPVDALAAQGTLELRRMRYSLAGGTDPLLGEVRVYDSRVEERRARAPQDTAPEAWKRASVDVRIDIPEDGRVQGQGANLEIAGKLVAEKQPAGPLEVRGAIDTKRGSYRIRGKAFVVEQAHVAFVGRPDLDPDLDVRAMHRVRNIRVYANVTGRASAATVRLTSDPPYPQDDVLALLLFGKTRDELSQQQAGALQSAIAGSAGAMALDSLSEELGFNIPIDTVEVEDAKSDSTTTVGVGGYVTEDVFVRYGHGVGAEAESNVRVDWRFRKRWSVETSISTRGDSSADLVWTYDY